MTRDGTYDRHYEKYLFVVPQGVQDLKEELACSTDLPNEVIELTEEPDFESDPFRIERFGGSEGKWEVLPRNEYLVEGRKVTLIVPVPFIAALDELAGLGLCAGASVSPNDLDATGVLDVTADQYTNYWLLITDNTGQGQKRRIVSNTATGPAGPVFTVDRAFDIPPDATTVFVITKMPNVHIVYRKRRTQAGEVAEASGEFTITGGVGNTGITGVPLRWDRTFFKGRITRVLCWRKSGNAPAFGLELRDKAGAAPADDGNRLFERATANRTRLDEVDVTMGNIPISNKDSPREDRIYFYGEALGGTLDTVYGLMIQAEVLK